MLFDYIEPIFRPPSEAGSLILQVTNGCSWNQCAFCEMYTAPQKKFQVTPTEQLRQQLIEARDAGLAVRRVFLADGDPMCLSFRRLHEIMSLINQYLPDVQRVSTYCLPSNLNNKSTEQLAELAAMGLSLMYVGCESGDDTVLDKIDKGETFDSSLAALLKIKQAGMKSSVMILNGLGGARYSEQHAINSARLMNAAQPDYLATLVLTMYQGEAHYRQRFGGDFEALDQLGLFQEIRTLLSHLDLDKTIFRSDHASNYLILKGVLGKDKSRMLAEVDAAIKAPQSAGLRQEWQRGL